MTFLGFLVLPKAIASSLLGFLLSSVFVPEAKDTFVLLNNVAAMILPDNKYLVY